MRDQGSAAATPGCFGARRARRARYCAAAPGATIESVRLGALVAAVLAPVGLVAAAAAGIALSGANPALPPAPSRQALPVPLTQVGAPSTHADVLAVEVDSLGSARYGNVYGGMWFGATGAVHVGVVESGTPAAARGLVAGIEQFGSELKARAVIVPVAHAYRSLRALTLEVKRTAALTHAGVTLVAWGPDPRSNTVVVRVLGSQRAARRILDHRFGTGWVTVEPWKGPPPQTGPIVTPGVSPRQAPNVTVPASPPESPNG
jgi:Alpha-lytic protease prodomain